MMVKTDRKDARGLAQLIRMGWFRPVHAKSMGSQEVRALLVARKQLLGRLIDVELSIRGIPARLWSEVGVVTRKGFEGRIRELVTGHITLERIAGAGSLRLDLGETLAQAPLWVAKALIQSASYPRSARSIDPDLSRDKSLKASRLS